MRVFLGTIAKNIEKSIEPLLRCLVELQTHLPDLHVFFYENNSTDNTRSYFPRLESTVRHIHIQSETLSESEFLKQGMARTSDNKPCRMEIIAHARNKLLDMMTCHGYDDNDLVILLDSDMIEPIIMAPLLAIIQDFPKDADGIFANGLSADKNRYYDMYALRHVESPYGPEISGSEFWDTLQQINILKRVPVFSAFGGLAIYRGYCLKHNSYSAIPTKSLDDLYKSIMHQSGYKQPKPDTHYKGALLGLYLFGNSQPNDIFYLNNSGYNFPVVCEHSTLHATMILRGQGRFFIHPELVYYSDH